jgi:hypothetical protein
MLVAIAAVSVVATVMMVTLARYDCVKGNLGRAPLKNGFAVMLVKNQFLGGWLRPGDRAVVVMNTKMYSVVGADHNSNTNFVVLMATG